MIVKIATIVLVAFVAISEAQEKRVWDGLSATWNKGSSKHSYDLPRTLDEARKQGWTRITGVGEPARIIPLCYQGDPTLTVLYQNSIATGIQIAFRVSDVEKSKQPLKYNNLGAILPKILNGVLYYTVTVNFYENKSTNVRTIFVQEKNGMFSIPTTTSQLLSKTKFLKKKCINGIGTSYYTWNSNSRCDGLYPVAVLADGQDVIGIALQALGHPTRNGRRNWWENFSDTDIKLAVGDPPQCALDAAKNFGTISLHIWFRGGSQKLSCR